MPKVYKKGKRNPHTAVAVQGFLQNSLFSLESAFACLFLIVTSA
nr:MAG TPA: hypothetical protein [Bacteriophage sp.]